MLLLCFLFLFLPKCCTDKVSVTSRWIVVKFGEMVARDVKLCHKVSKCYTLRQAHRHVKSTDNSIYYLSKTERIVLIFYITNTDTEF